MHTAIATATTKAVHINPSLEGVETRVVKVDVSGRGHAKLVSVVLVIYQIRSDLPRRRLPRQNALTETGLAEFALISTRVVRRVGLFVDRLENGDGLAVDILQKVRTGRAGVC